MHAGYPIVTHLDVCDPKHTGIHDDWVLSNESLLRKGSWGLFHEIGHNMQRASWTFEGTGEVTCNLFTLHAMDVICGVNPWIHPWLKNNLARAKQHIAENGSFDVWMSHPGIALFIYGQLAHQFGWGPYKHVFRLYESMADADKPQSQQSKIDRFFSLFSQAVNLDLSPLLDFWNIPFSDEARAKSAHLQPFLPDDELTQGTEKVTAIEQKYVHRNPALCSSATGLFHDQHVFEVSLANASGPVVGICRQSGAE